MIRTEFDDAWAMVKGRWNYTDADREVLWRRAQALPHKAFLTAVDDVLLTWEHRHKPSLSTFLAKTAEQAKGFYHDEGPKGVPARPEVAQAFRRYIKTFLGMDAKAPRDIGAALERREGRIFGADPVDVVHATKQLFADAERLGVRIAEHHAEELRQRAARARADVERQPGDDGDNEPAGQTDAREFRQWLEEGSDGEGQDRDATGDCTGVVDLLAASAESDRGGESVAETPDRPRNGRSGLRDRALERPAEDVTDDEIPF